MTLLSAMLLVSVALYTTARRLAFGAPDYRTLQDASIDHEAGTAEVGTPDGETPTAALLAEGGGRLSDTT